MTSKEALEELYKLTCIDNRNNVCASCELCAVILHDLEQLEKYKNAIKIINDALELYVADDEIGVENRSSFIDYEDSELLKEVLNYE